jgi:group I intron endonuclease
VDSSRVHVVHLPVDGHDRIRSMFIYLITNDVNTKAYVGLFSGKRLRHRWAVHKWDAQGTSQIPLHRAMRKHGIEKFHIASVWSGYVSRENLARLEKYYIASFNTKSPNGYNLTNGGDGSVGFAHSEAYKASMRGRFISEATRKKMSLIHKGKTISPQQRAAVSIKMRGNKHLLGHVPTAETRMKLSVSGKGKKKPPLSEEARERIRAFMKGRRLSPESQKKRDESFKQAIARRKAKQNSSEVNNQPRREEAQTV